MKIHPLLIKMKVNYTSGKYSKIIGNKVYTDDTDELIAEVELKNYKIAILHYVTKSKPDKYRIAEFRKAEERKTKITEKPRHGIFVCDNSYVCQYCNNLIMHVYEENLINCAIYIKCQCGEIYDLKYFLKPNFLSAGSNRHSHIKRGNQKL